MFVLCELDMILILHLRATQELYKILLFIILNSWRDNTCDIFCQVVIMTGFYVIIYLAKNKHNYDSIFLILLHTRKPFTYN